MPRADRGGQPAPERHRDAASGGGVAPRGGESRRRGGRGRAARSAPRAAGRPQGPDPHPRHPDDVRVAHLRGPRPRGGRADRRAPAGSGGHHHRQDQHPRVRRRFADLQRGLRAYLQPLGRDEDLRREQRRRGGGARHRDGPDRRRQRLRRLAPQPRELLRSGRAPALARPGAGLAGRDPLVPGSGPGADGAERRRCRVDVERDRRAGFPGAALASRSGRGLRSAARAGLRGSPRGVESGLRGRPLRSAGSGGARPGAGRAGGARLRGRGRRAGYGRRGRGVRPLAGLVLRAQLGPAARPPPGPHEGNGHLEHRAGQGARRPRPRGGFPPVDGAAAPGAGVLRALRVPGAAGVPGSAVRHHPGIPHRDRRGADADVHRLDGVLRLGVAAGVSRRVGSGRENPGRAARGPPDRRPSPGRFRGPSVGPRAGRHSTGRDSGGCRANPATLVFLLRRTDA